MWIYPWRIDAHSYNSKEGLKEKGVEWEIQTLITIVLDLVRM
jgi:hypothetical protein